MLELVHAGPEELFPDLLPLVSPQRQQRARRMPPLPAQLGMLAELLLRCAVVEQLGLPWDTPLGAGANGKPVLSDRPDFCFSLAHTMRTGRREGCAVLATAALPVGVDVEAPSVPRIRVAQRCFTPEELDWMQQDPAERFWVLWTRKEAVVKRSGLGFSGQPFSSFSVLGLPSLSTQRCGPYLLSLCTDSAEQPPLRVCSAQTLLQRARALAAER